jgi:ArsR family transcriptional regulator
MSKEQKMLCIFKALSDENRIRIFKMLRSGEKCACKLLEELNISQPTLSHHMKILCDAGIVTGRKEGKWTHYSISCDGVRLVRELMKELLSAETISVDCECKEV